MGIFVFGIVITAFWGILATYGLYHKRRMGFLRSVMITNEELPAVQIIIAVRNEEQHLAQALQSVCNLQYKNYRVLLINDRSTDHTASIMQSFREKNSHVTILTITDLPKGWLGKNHALYQGYLHCKEEWMLFTDADVVYAPDTLQKAMSYVVKEKVDHLTILPEVKSRSEWLNSLLAMFVILLEARQRPWAVRNPDSSAYLGIGAFNLVNRIAYERAGTHKAFALRPDDDLKLGKRIKITGSIQDALYGEGQISLEWYTSVKEFINGLMKNAFSAFNYNFLLLLITGVLPMFILLVAPLPLLIIAGHNAERVMAIIIFTAQLCLFVLPRTRGAKWWYVFMIPVAGLVMMYILLKAGILTLRQKGIYWRESFYSLNELKKGL